MRALKTISPYQFAAFRIVFGVYLVIHFAYLIPYGTELFSREGVIGDARLNFTHGILPNPLEHWDTPLFITTFLVVLVLLAIAFTVGFCRRTAALLLWYGWACLFNRNNLISNPSIPYIGLILLLCVVLPPGEPLCLRRRKKTSPWVFPAGVYWTAWLLLAIGYAFSGCMKLCSPSWVDGTAMLHLVNNPLARPGIFRDLFLRLPEWAIHTMTWSVLAMELLFLPLSIHRVGRLVAWVGMLAMHLGILLMVDFADLSFGMVMIHLFTFDPDWLPARRKEPGQLVVLFDGVCGLCDRTVQFLLGEDRDGLLQFAPLQGQTAQSVIARHSGVPGDLKSLIFVRNHAAPEESVLLRSEGALQILNELGGFWRVVSWLRVVPRRLRDRVYDWVARNRYNWFGKFSECRIPTPETQKRFLP